MTDPEKHVLFCGILRFRWACSRYPQVETGLEHRGIRLSFPLASQILAEPLLGPPRLCFRAWGGSSMGHTWSLLFGSNSQEGYPTSEQANRQLIVNRTEVYGEKWDGKPNRWVWRLGP